VFCFRLPFTMSRTSLLGITDSRLDLLDHAGLRVWLTSTRNEPEPISEATELVVRGEGYETVEDAAHAGEHWRDVLSRAFARVHVAADFGDRKPFGTLTAAGEAMLAREQGVPIKSDMPGVTVFECHPDIRFASMRGEPTRRPSEAQSHQVIRAASEHKQPLTDVERIAFDLYSGSFFQPSADGRLLMLMMAIETMLDLGPRPDSSRAHVEALIHATRSNPDLNDSERSSLVSSLRWLLDESIGQAGRRLAATLEPRRYLNLPPVAFFNRCYKMRSALAHGRVPRPARGEVDYLAANLEVFVGDLLAGDLIDLPEPPPSAQSAT
jgi:hypothetical protein